MSDTTATSTHHLHVILDESALDNTTIQARNKGTNKPELRQQLILDKLKQIFNDNNTTYQYNSEQATRDRLIQLHDSDYIDFLAQAHNSIRKYKDKDWYNHDDDSLVIYNIYTPPNIMYGHNTDTNYLQYICEQRKKSLSRQPIYKQAGYFAKDNMTPILAHTYKQVTRSAQCSILAAEYLIQNPTHIVYALVSSPGHHVDGERMAGYCFLNNCALAAQRLTEQYKRVGILDIDYHAYVSGP